MCLVSGHTSRFGHSAQLYGVQLQTPFRSVAQVDLLKGSVPSSLPWGKSHCGASVSVSHIFVQFAPRLSWLSLRTTGLLSQETPLALRFHPNPISSRLTDQLAIVQQISRFIPSLHVCQVTCDNLFVKTRSKVEVTLAVKVSNLEWLLGQLN